MTKNDYLLLRRAETPKTLRLLELFPDEKRDMRPAPGSRSAFELALTFLGEERVNRDLVEGRPIKPAPIANRPTNMAEVVSALREAVRNLNDAVEKLTFTIYSRIAGGRVPQIYGPSGDEP